MYIRQWMNWHEWFCLSLMTLSAYSLTLFVEDCSHLVRCSRKSCFYWFLILSVLLVFDIVKRLKRLKPSIALNGKPITELWSVTCHMGSHILTCHLTQVIVPRHNLSQPGRYSIYLPGKDWRMEGWVDLGSLIVARPGIELTPAWAQVRRPNPYCWLGDMCIQPVKKRVQQFQNVLRMGPCLTWSNLGKVGSFKMKVVTVVVF